MNPYRQARDEAGLSREGATQALAGAYPELAITTKTLERIEAGSPVKLTLAAALCDLYGKKLSDLAPEKLDESRTLSDLLIRMNGYFQETLRAS